MKPKISTPLFVLVFAVAVTVSGAAPGSATTTNVAVQLHYGKDILLKQEAIERLRAKAEELLETSNFNSSGTGRTGWQWNVSKIHDSYRQTVAGKYLLVNFTAPRKFQSVGGDLSVLQIVIGLNRPDYASSLFTIDGEGRVIDHSKYSGPLCVKLLEAVNEIVKGQGG